MEGLIEVFCSNVVSVYWRLYYKCIDTQSRELCVNTRDDVEGVWYTCKLYTTWPRLERNAKRSTQWIIGFQSSCTMYKWKCWCTCVSLFAGVYDMDVRNTSAHTLHTAKQWQSIYV